MSKKKDPYLDKVRKILKKRIVDVFVAGLGIDFALLEGRSKLVFVQSGVLNTAEHQRRTTRNLLDLVQKGGYLACVIPLCNNFPNRGVVRNEMALFGLKTIHLELENNVMLYLGQK